ncbi:LOW QUALITY PROTEIN: exocyst complex component 5-like [Pollicipes pollicipes]|uniref:LOW QUALITY PROTEIN: exocyst complex component 5-like n=1 Tax=Pollicipes pollicipes TaxID=41117 RepID=UPI0018857E2C|nr:LOW QUALITY PROTEIN: exocyst complex component 5-like [Pollicipes pollicipes]
MMMYKLLDEVEQESFSADDFVERLAWRASGGNLSTKTDNEDFNPQIIHDAFSSAIRQLTDIQRKQQRECDQLEAKLKDEEARYAQRVHKLMDRNKDDFSILHQLDEKISFVATKVVHLGDQLESVNTPRSRDERALQLMQHLNRFIDAEAPTDPLFDDDEQIFEAADVIQKLYLISQELPSGKFEGARTRIGQKYDGVERRLIERFVAAQKRGDRDAMKEVASVLSQFKGYSQCVDAFIEQSQQGAFVSRDIFREIVPVCERNEPIIHYVFHNPAQVMGRFVLIIFHGRLQEHLHQTLADQSNRCRYLDQLCDLYSRTQHLTKQLAKFNMGHDSSFLNKLAKKLFQEYISSYISVEVKQLRQCCADTLDEYYTSQGHQKRHLYGGLGELRREAAAVLGTKTSINIAAVDDHGGRTFLSEETAINLLQEAKRAFKRCQVLSRPQELAQNALQLFDILASSLLVEHIDYGIELALQAVPVNEPRAEPQLYFYDVVRQTNGVVHLLEKQYADSLLPLVVGSSCQAEAASRRRALLSGVQTKLDLGLDRTLSAACAWVRVILQTEQKKADFRPDTEEVVLASATQACRKVVRFISSQAARIKDSCDGKNVDAVLTELGERLHRTVLEHLLQFQYNTTGAMAAICDVNEYRKCVESWRIASVTALFETLHSLCNLLLVLPDNLRQVCSQGSLAGLDRAVLMNFIQLRADYKTSKLALQLRW